MNTLNEDKLTEVVINFEEIRKNKLNESFLAMFGHWVKTIVSRMFGGAPLPVSVQGTPSEVNAFARAVGQEKKYIETARDFGLDNPRTYKDNAILNKAVGSFEKVTGIKWPFK